MFKLRDLVMRRARWVELVRQNEVKDDLEVSPQHIRNSEGYRSG